jgi:hypothetical protein
MNRNYYSGCAHSGVGQYPNGLLEKGIAWNTSTDSMIESIRVGL